MIYYQDVVIPAAGDLIGNAVVANHVIRYEEQCRKIRRDGYFVRLIVTIDNLNRFGKMKLNAGDLEAVGPENIAGSMRFYMLADLVVLSHNGEQRLMKYNGRGSQRPIALDWLPGVA